MEINYRQNPVVVVDDEPDILRSFAYNYGDEFEVLTAESGSRGLELLQTHDPAVIVADQRMPVMNGVEFLHRSMQLRPDANRIILTGYTDVEAIVAAINSSRIFRYLTKPWESEELRLTLHRAVEMFQLTRENARLVEELRHANERLSTENAYLRGSAGPHEIVGDSPAIREVLALVGKVAGSPATVLLEGETGTGKELVARAIHTASPRRDRLFVAVSETTPALQAKLLRVLQEGEVRPVGENRARRVDVRIIAATNHQLAEEVKVGRFREDLYFRLRVFPIRLPPLRDRLEDLPALARHLVRRIATQLKKPVGELTEEALSVLARYPFPGNVRELANELERAVLLSEPGAPLTEDLLSEHLQTADGGGSPGVLESRTAAFEREQIDGALARAGGVKSRAAAELGITYRGLLKKMRRLGM